MPQSDAADAFEVTDDEGNAYPVAQVEIVNDKEITLIMEEELALSKAYSVNRQGYEGCSVSMDKIIGSTYFAFSNLSKFSRYEISPPWLLTNSRNLS